MRILHIISGLKRGGAETQLFRICQFDQDNDHFVVSLSNKEGYGDILEKINVSVYALNFSSGKINISGLIKLYRIMKQLKPDVVQTWMNHADLIGGIIARIAGIKNIFWGVHQTILIKGKSKASESSNVWPSYKALILAFFNAIYIYFSSPEAKSIPSNDIFLACTGPFLRLNFLFIVDVD